MESVVSTLKQDAYIFKFIERTGQERHLKIKKKDVVYKSPEFETLLQGQSPILITDMNPELFNDLLQFIEKERVVLLSATHALQVYLAARQYHLEALEDFCVDFIKSRAQLTAEEVFGILKESALNRDKKLESSCIKAMEENTSSLLNSKAFYRADAEELMLILKRDKLNVLSESVLIDAYQKWALNKNDDTVTNMDLFGQFISLFRFKCISVEEFRKFCRYDMLHVDDSNMICDLIEEKDYIFPNWLSQKKRLFYNYTTLSIDVKRQFVAKKCSALTIKSFHGMVDIIGLSLMGQMKSLHCFTGSLVIFKNNALSHVIPFRHENTDESVDIMFQPSSIDSTDDKIVIWITYDDLPNVSIHNFENYSEILYVVGEQTAVTAIHYANYSAKIVK